MPLYEYTCRKCERTFEALVTARAAEAEEVRCPGCDGTDLDRLFGLPARGRVADAPAPSNCRGAGPPCGAPWCGRTG